MTGTNGAFATNIDMPEREMVLNESQQKELLRLQGNYMELCYNTIAARSGFLQNMLDPRRDIDKECGFPATSTITPQFYRELYDRLPTATRLVNAIPEETWQVLPDIVEDDDEGKTTKFEQAYADLGKSIRVDSKYSDDDNSVIWEYLARVDRLSRIGHFGILLLGISDNQPLYVPIQNAPEDSGSIITVPAYTEGNRQADPKQMTLPGMRYIEGAMGTDAQYTGVQFSPVSQPTGKGSGKRELLFLRAFDESLVQIVQYEASPYNRRYGLPVMYTITLNDPREKHTGVGLPQATVRVHWSRVIHVADKLGASEIFGVPAMRPNLNCLLNINKILGSSGEGYWKGAFMGISFETHPTLGGEAQVNVTNLRQQMWKFQNDLQRFLISTGMTAKTLAPQVTDPTPHIDVNTQMICVETGMPQRIFMGSERGELASSQDKDTWEQRLVYRRKMHVTPRIIVPFVDRLITCKVLPEPESYKVKWPTVDNMAETDKATIAQSKTTAMAAYLSSGLEALMTPEDYLVKVQGFSTDDAQQIIESAKEATESGETLTPQQQFDEQGNPIDPNADPNDPNAQGAVDPNAPDEETTDEDEDPEKEPISVNAVTVINKIVANYNPKHDRLGRFASGSGGGATGAGVATRQGSLPRDPVRPYKLPESNSLYLRQMKHVKDLGGSTGTKLVEDGLGRRFVMKKGKSAEHARNEYHANRMLAAAGVPVPKQRLYETKSGPVLLTRELKERKELGKLEGDEKKAAYKQVQKHFAAHALLANWDAVGMSHDNVLVGKSGKVHFIDNGGALEFRAQGGKKGEKFGKEVGELKTMTSYTKNEAAAKVFSGMSAKDLHESIQSVLSKKGAILAVTPEHLKPLMKQRFRSLSEQGTTWAKLAGATVEKPLIPKQGRAFQIPPAAKPEITMTGVKPVKIKPKEPELLSHPQIVEKGSQSKHDALWNAVEKAGVTKLQLAKMKHFNPNGAEGGTFTVSTSLAKNEKSMSAIKQLLPAGTVIKAKKASKKELEKIKGSDTASGGEKTVSATTVASHHFVQAKSVAPAEGVRVHALDASWESKMVGLFDKARKTLKDDEYAAIASWKGSARGIRKAFAKAGGKVPESGSHTYADEARNLHAALQKMPVVTGTVYRGIKDESNTTPGYASQMAADIKKAGVGGIWSDSAPHCMSRNRETARTFGSNGGKGHLVFVIKTKTGRAIERIASHAGEEEVVGMANTRYKITKIAENTSVVGPNSIGRQFRTVVHLEEI